MAYRLILTDIRYLHSADIRYILTDMILTDPDIRYLQKKTRYLGFSGISVIRYAISLESTVRP